MFDYRLALMTGVDIPIPELQIILHQPSIEEISRLGETTFFTGLQLLCINKMMYIEDENLLNTTTNFQIFMTMMNEKQIADKKQDVISTLTLLFPEYKPMFTPRSVILNGPLSVTIDEGNFESVQGLLKEVFCLGKGDQPEFNPANAKAREIAKKLMKGRQRVAALKQAENNGSMLGQYISIVTVGIHSMSLQSAIQLTMYQLYDLIERYDLWVNWDLDIKSRLAGAKGDKPVDNWMKQIH